MTSQAHISAEAPRFTVDGSDELELRLAELCREIRARVAGLVPARKLQAVVLAGGYGRGEGGVLRQPEGDLPYNDLEFYVFVKGNSVLNTYRYQRPLERLGESLSPAAGLHVEFKLDSLQKLQKAPVSIFSYDLVSRHRIVYGEPGLFRSCGRHLQPQRIEGTEAARLLLNRCSGLLLASELLQKGALTPDECDFVGRNIAKAQLALGDALLAAHGEYHWSCIERGIRLKRSTIFDPALFFDRLLEHHASGIRFKLHPSRAAKSVDEFSREHREITRLAFAVWLWIENRRLGTRFETIESYALSPVAKCSGGKNWRNVLLNLKTFGAGATLDKYSPRYPRERLLNALPLLLAKCEVAPPATKRHLQRQLHTRAEDWPQLVGAYKQLWSCYG